MDGTPLDFGGRRYRSIAALYRAWEGEKPSERTFEAKLRNFRRRNPRVAMTDEVIRHLFQTRSGKHALMFQGVLYRGPRELHKAWNGEKIGYGAFWLRLKEYTSKHPDAVLDDVTIAGLIAPDYFVYRGNRYRSLAALYKAVPGHKITRNRFVGNVGAWRRDHPDRTMTDEALEQCVRFMGGEHECRYRGVNYRSLKSLYDDQPTPKCLWATFQQRVQKLSALRDLTDDDISLLLKPQAKVRFFRGILYRWTHLPTGKVYIGISSQTLKERIRLHERQAKAGQYTSPLSLQAAIRSDGIDAFKIEVLREFNDEDSMKAAEEQAVREHNCLAPGGFNLQEGGRSWTKQGTDVEFEGVTYPSYAALAAAFGISEKLLDGRRRWGWTLADALRTPPFARSKSSKSVVVRGIRYESLLSAAKAHGVKPKSLYSKLNEGWPLEDALGLTSRKPRTRTEVIVDGQRFPTISAAARHFGKNPREVYWKMDRGKSIDEALGLK